MVNVSIIMVNIDYTVMLFQGLISLSHMGY